MNLYLYIDEDTFFHRLDPRTKLFLLLSVFIAATLQEAFYGSLIILLLVFLHGFISRTLTNLRRIWFILVLIFILSTFVWTINLDGKTPFYFGAELEPFLYGLGTGIKLDAMIIAGLIFLSTTANEEIALALVRLKVPYKFTFAFTTALRLVPTFIGSALTVASAQKSRGVELDRGNLFIRIKKYLPLLGPVLLLTLRYTVQLSMALESKCFGAVQKRSFYMYCKFDRCDFMVLALLFSALTLCIYLKYMGYFVIEGLVM